MYYTNHQHNVLYKPLTQLMLQVVFEMFKGIAKVYMNMITDDIRYKIL